MKRVTVFFFLIAASLHVFAQNTDTTKKQSPWTHKGLTGFNLSQTALSDWAAGGENTIAANVYFNGQLNYKKGHLAWDNQLNTEFGMFYTATNKWQKNVDKLQYTSKLGITSPYKKLYYSFLANLLTQYAKGYKNPTDENYISTWMAPGYLNLALGVDYKPSSVFTIFYSPLTGRMTFVLDDSLSRAGAFGVDPGRRTKSQLGMYFKAGLDWKITNNIKIISTLDMFSGYEKFGIVVVNWDLLMSMKINKYLSTTLNLALKYDDAVKTKDADGSPRGPKVQFREMLGIGFAYSL